MSLQYDDYLAKHREAVRSGLKWFEKNLPNVIYQYIPETELNSAMFTHDQSKDSYEEYGPYDNYFYGNNRSYAVEQAFNYAWLHHIHNNPHHWQYWILINDDKELGEIVLEMEPRYIIEMICDWWAFSWIQGDLYEVFSWYDQHKDYIKMGETTRKLVENILEKMATKLDELANS